MMPASNEIGRMSTLQPACTSQALLATTPKQLCKCSANWTMRIYSNAPWPSALISTETCSHRTLS